MPNDPVFMMNGSGGEGSRPRGWCCWDDSAVTTTAQGATRKNDRWKEGGSLSWTILRPLKRTLSDTYNRGFNVQAYREGRHKRNQKHKDSPTSYETTIDAGATTSSAFNRQQPGSSVLLALDSLACFLSLCPFFELLDTTTRSYEACSTVGVHPAATQCNVCSPGAATATVQSNKTVVDANAPKRRASLKTNNSSRRFLSLAPSRA